MNKKQEEGRSSDLSLRADIICFSHDVYIGMVAEGQFNYLHVTKPCGTKIDAIYELTGFFTHLKDEADKCLNELFTKVYEIEASNRKKNSEK